MPIIGAITGGLDFSNYYLGLSSTVKQGLAYADAKKAGAALGWGAFLTAVVNFVIIAWVLFLAVKALNKMKKQEAAAPAAPAEPPEDVKLLGEIRDLLAKKK
jgi:large conductance mechanosensitive channel